MTTYTSENKDIILELNSKYTIFSKDRIICNIVFKNNIGTILANVKLPDYELINLIDNIYAFLYIQDNIMYTIRSYTDIDCKSYTVGLSTEYDLQYGFLNNTPKRYISLYTYQDELMIKILSFEVTHTLDELTDLLYEYFIENNLSDDTKKEVLNL
jgi:hypothetical protein